MNAISVELIETIKELQLLKSLSKFSLGGGTNLAIRYNHRISIDIDLFNPDIIGKAAFEQIVDEVKSFYGGRLYGCDFPCDIDDQFVFLRFFIKKNDVVIKVEVLQNFKAIDQPQLIAGVRLLTERDIGLLKLMSVSNRASNKDVYDLDYITAHVPLIELYDLLKYKLKTFNKSSDQTIFDLDKEESPIDNPKLLLKFDISLSQNRSRSAHTHDRIVILQGEKTWAQARSGWRTKVRQLYDHLGTKFPDIKGVDI